MDIISFVNDKDEEIGSGEKYDVIEHGLIRRVVHVQIIDENENFLFQKRLPTDPRLPNILASSAGGHAKPGEDYLAVAKRKLKEEIRINASELNLQVIDKSFTDFQINGQSSKAFMASVVVKAKRKEFKVMPNFEKVAGILWFSKDEVVKAIANHPSDFTPGTLFLLKKYFSLLY